MKIYGHDSWSIWRFVYLIVECFDIDWKAMELEYMLFRFISIKLVLILFKDPEFVLLLKWNILSEIQNEWIKIFSIVIAFIPKLKIYVSNPWWRAYLFIYHFFLNPSVLRPGFELSWRCDGA